MPTITPGAHLTDDGQCHFFVWAPSAISLELVLLGPEPRALAMEPVDNRGHYQRIVPGVQAGDLYTYRVHGDREVPDPASRYLPEGVHGPSQVMSSHFDWQATTWRNLALRDYIFYELHVGTFTQEGTFEAIIPHLPDLKALGITAIELMPVAQFAGTRNWGYDGVQPYAVQNTYGGPEGLKKLVDACHQQGLAVVLDVVYNHLGPEGNYLDLFGPYFTDRYRTPWGSSLNFDGPQSDEVRRYFIQNAIYWLDEFRIDALRLDAVHAIYDFSAVMFIEELASTVQAWSEKHGRRVYLIAESDRSDAKLVQPQEANGAGMDGQWLDDLHHCLHVHLTGQRTGYYSDYADRTLAMLVKCLRDGFVFSGDYSPFRRRRHGTSSRGIPGDRYVVCTQNHDQVGNRVLGERLSVLTDTDGLKLAAGIVIFSSYLPLLFMGEEYGETAPFLFFTDYGDEALIEAMRKGRIEEFSYFAGTEELYDPQDEAIFAQCILNRDLRQQEPHQGLYEFYRTLLHLRRTIPALNNPDKNDLDVLWYDHLLILQRRAHDSAAVVVFNLHLDHLISQDVALPPGQWRTVFQSAEAIQAPETCAGDTRIHLDLPAKSFVLFVHES